MNFHLSQNYPNPFKDKTKIKYCIPYRTRIIISVIDNDGNEIENLVNKEQNAGTYEIDFYKGSLLEGSYECKMVANDYTEVKKMILSK